MSLDKLFTYIQSKQISVFEKLFLLGGTVAYVISPIDILPLNPLDDIGVVGVVAAYINWRVKRLEAPPHNDKTETTEVVKQETHSRRDNNFAKNFFSNKK